MRDILILYKMRSKDEGKSMERYSICHKELKDDNVVYLFDGAKSRFCRECREKLGRINKNGIPQINEPMSFFKNYKI